MRTRMVLACRRALLVVFALFLAILPRSAGALVVHAHEGHGLHAHVVGSANGAGTRLDSAQFHARYHAHAHCDGEHAGHDPEGDELLIGLPADPLRGTPAATWLPSHAVERATCVEIAAFVVALDAPRERAVRPRPPRERGRTARSGTRRLLRTSAALRH